MLVIKAAVGILFAGCVCFLSHQAGLLKGFSADSSLKDIWNESFHHQQKLDLVWDSVSSQIGRSNSWPPLLEFLRRFVFVGDDYTRLRLPFTFRENPKVAKILHTFASTAKVQFRFNQHANALYTGLFTEPEISGIMTASTGNRVASNQTLQFGWGFKFFRTNALSANILTLNSLSGELVWNIFGQMTCNHNSLSESFILLPHSVGWTAFPGQNGLSNMAWKTLSGEDVPEPSFPYALCFTPAPRIQANLRSAKPFVHSYEQLHIVPANEHLLDVWAITHPTILEDPESLGKFSIKIGEVWSLTSFVKSLFVDQHVFFQHQPFEEDLYFRPDWRPFMTPLNLMNEGALYAYRGLFEREPPSLEAFQYTLSTLSRAAISLFTDPVTRRNFIMSELGVGRNIPYFSSRLLELPLISDGPIGDNPISDMTNDQLIEMTISLFERLSSPRNAGKIPEWLMFGHNFPVMSYIGHAEQAAMWVRLISQLKQ